MTAPAWVTFETSRALSSVNHMLPSGPAAIRSGWLADVGTQYSWIETPDAVIVALATLLALCSVTQTVPPGPAATSIGQLPGVGKVNWATEGVLDGTTAEPGEGPAAAGCPTTINANGSSATANTTTRDTDTVPPRAAWNMVLTVLIRGPGRTSATPRRPPTRASLQSRSLDLPTAAAEVIWARDPGPATAQASTACSSTMRRWTCDGSRWAPAWW